MNKEVRPFEEYKEMIHNMSKDNMIKGLYDLSANIIEKDKEIERLNNIIDEIDNKLCSTWQSYYDHSRLTTFKCEDMLYLIEQIRKDINELKGE